MDAVQAAIAALPPPPCPEGFGAQCPGPFQPIDPVTNKPIGNPVEPQERVRSESRAGEIDVTVRCKHCQARAHYTLDAKTGAVLEGGAHAEPAGSDPIFAVASSASDQGKMGLTPSAEETEGGSERATE